MTKPIPAALIPHYQAAKAWRAKALRKHEVVWNTDGCWWEAQAGKFRLCVRPCYKDKYLAVVRFDTKYATVEKAIAAIHAVIPSVEYDDHDCLLAVRTWMQYR